VLLSVDFTAFERIEWQLKDAPGVVYNARMAKKKPVQTTTTNRTGKPVNVWIDPALYEALRAYLGSQRPRPTTTSVVEVALEDFLRARGFWPPSSDD